MTNTNQIACIYVKSGKKIHNFVQTEAKEGQTGRRGEKVRGGGVEVLSLLLIFIPLSSYLYILQVKPVKWKGRTRNRYEPRRQTVLDVRKCTMAMDLVSPAWEGKKIRGRERFETDGTAGSGE